MAEPATTWSTSWTNWIRGRISISSPPRDDDPALREVLAEVARLTDVRLTPVRFLAAGEVVDAATVGRLRDEAAGQLDRHGYVHNGKWNAVVDEQAESVLDLVDLPALVLRHAGLRVHEPRVATYIAYRRPGEFLDFHLDDFSFGSINLILCLEHESAGEDLSETVFLTPDGPQGFVLRPGEAILFDGAASPHARTPIRPGERVVLLSYGFDAVDDSRAADLGGMPAPGRPSLERSA